jgi:hypothetical protein
MRQLTASEASNDEMERQREAFNAWFKSSYHPDRTGPYLKDIMFFTWQAALKSKQGEV